MVEESTVLIQLGSIALTPKSLPALFAVVVYLSLFSAKAVAFKKIGALDLLVYAACVSIIVSSFPLTLGSTPTKISFLALSWPFVGFIIFYGLWRVIGKRPFHSWPWYRFGLCVTLSIFTADLIFGLVCLPGAGRVWILGGAGLMDALFLGPMVLTGFYYAYLDCKSPLVFCGKNCRQANKCLYPAPEPAHTESEQRLSIFALIGKSIIVLFGSILILHFGQDVQVLKKTDPETFQAVIPELRAHLEKLSEKFNIPTPQLRFVNVDTYAFTLPPDSQNKMSVIQLGNKIVEQILPEKSIDILEAIITHEFGHAILFNQGQKIPALEIMGVYLLAISVSLLGFFGKVRALLIIIFVDIVLFRGATSWLLFSTKDSILLIIVANTALGFTTINSKLSRITGIPFNPVAALIACFASFAILFLGNYWLGKKNHEIEFFADTIALCESKPGAYLSFFESLPQKRQDFWTAIHDPYHPSVTDRIAKIKGFNLTECPSIFKPEH